MPTNVTPQYRSAEEAFRRAQSTAERLTCLEAMLQLVPKHKGSEKLQADIKTRIRETRTELQHEKTAGSAARGDRGFRLARQGAATIVIIGGPNAGKSRLLKELTRAEPEVAPYPFTTRTPLPGILEWNEVSLQLVDTPPITDQLLEPAVLNLVRTADLVLLAMDGSSDEGPQQTAEVVMQLRQRKTRLANANGFDEQDYSIVHVRTRAVITRGAPPHSRARWEQCCRRAGIEIPSLMVELDEPAAVTQLKDELFFACELLRIYTKVPNQPAELVDPFPLPAGSTVEDLAARVHRNFAGKVKFARIWNDAGAGVRVGRDHPLRDRDVVELHL